MDAQWLKWAKKMQAIAQAGLTYGKDIYDIERYQMLRDLSIEIMSKYTDLEDKKIRDLFANETGYQTPKVDIRSVVFQDRKILMVQEKSDGKWALPGGWCDIGETPAEMAVRETEEESGYKVKPVKLLAILDKKKYPHPPDPYHIYKIFILCEIVGGKGEKGLETDNVGFFAETNLPPLSIERNTESQLQLMFEFLHNPDKLAIFD